MRRRSIQLIVLALFVSVVAVASVIRGRGNDRVAAPTAEPVRASVCAHDPKVVALEPRRSL